jgi:hypothetical protein
MKIVKVTDTITPELAKMAARIKDKRPILETMRLPREPHSGRTGIGGNLIGHIDTQTSAFIPILPLKRNSTQHSHQSF